MQRFFRCADGHSGQFRIISILTITLWLSGCASKGTQAVASMQTCLSAAEQRHPVGAALVATDGMPTTSQMSMRGVPSQQHLKLVGAFWNERDKCALQGFEVAKSELRPDEVAYFYDLYNRRMQVQLVFLSGEQTWGEYFQAVARAQQESASRLSQLQDKRDKQAARSAPKVIINNQNSGGGNPYFKPYCPPSRYPIYGCN